MPVLSLLDNCFNYSETSIYGRAKGIGKMCRTLTRFRYIRRGYFFFIIFYYYYGKEDRSSYRGLHYIEALYIEVSTVLLN